MFYEKIENRNGNAIFFDRFIHQTNDYAVIKLLWGLVKLRQEIETFLKKNIEIANQIEI